MYPHDTNFDEYASKLFTVFTSSPVLTFPCVSLFPGQTSFLMVDVLLRFSSSVPFQGQSASAEAPS